MCMHPRRSHMHAVARKLLFRLFCYPANGIRPSVIFKCDAPPECPGRVYVPYFNFDCFFRYFLSPFTPHPSRQNLIFFFCSHDKDREGEKERGRERRRQAARWSTARWSCSPPSPRRCTVLLQCPLRAVRCPLFLVIDLSLCSCFCLCVPALGVGLRSHSSMPRQRSPATGFPFAARRSACRPASSASALCARPAPSRARREPR